jgi:hypothetical protein
MTTDRKPLQLQACPFCGAGETQVRENCHPPTMRGPGALISVTIQHWCDKSEGMLSGSCIKISGRDYTAAETAWNRRLVVDAALAKFEATTQAVPLGLECRSKGRSVYNWRRHLLDEFKTLLGRA